MSDEPTLKEIARRINAHLKRFEADPEINKVNSARASSYYNAGASARGGWVSITYVSYQGSTALRRDKAQQYLDWLDAGNVGRHVAAGVRR